MQSFIRKSISHVEKMFPEIYATREKRGSYHFALAWERSTLIAAGVNRPERTDAKALEFAKRFHLKEKLDWPMLHAEEAMLSRLIALDKLHHSLNIVVLRLNKFGVFGMSKPCENCSIILQAYGLNKIWYSDEKGNVVNDF